MPVIDYPIWIFDGDALIYTRTGYWIDTQTLHFDHWYDHISMKTWGDKETLKQFYMAGWHNVGRQWMEPKTGFRTRNEKLSQCSICNAVVMIHDLGCCRWCSVPQPDSVQHRYEAWEAIYSKADQLIREDSENGLFEAMLLMWKGTGA